MRGAAPWHGDGGFVLSRHHHVGAGGDVPFHELVLLEIVPIRLENGEDGLGRGIGRKALPEHQDIKSVEAGRLQADVGGDLAGGVHLGHVRRQQQALLGELLAPALLRQQHPVLFTSGVGIVAARGQCGLDHFRRILDERANHVADDLGALEQFGQRFDGVFHLHDFIVCGFDAGNLFHHGLYLRLVAPGGNEGNIVFAQIFADQAAGVARDAIDDDGFLLAHGVILSNDLTESSRLREWRRRYVPMPPSTGRPAPVMKRASSEQRKATEAAMSPCSQSRPSGVCSITEATAALTSAASPNFTISLASRSPISLATRPG